MKTQKTKNQIALEFAEMLKTEKKEAFNSLFHTAENQQQEKDFVKNHFFICEVKF